ncbi:MAG TPA: Gfo/Idh/MocA family oxidoreductase [Anaerolineae bacterium]|nr:Gfo/Idh/MocA family oxidoreductase [Anaerolineae bacterium]
MSEARRILSMSKKGLGVCVVGCGDMGNKHAERWNRLTDARVVAVVDILEERAKRLADRCGLDTWYTDYRPAISREDVNVVSVCVPTYLHPEIAIFAANQGKHVLSEKPIALTLQGADAMIEAARRHRVKLAVGFMRRYSPVLPKLRDWLAAGHLGRPVMYYATDVREIRPKREMHDAHANGGPVIDMGVHLFDGWTYIFDAQPVEVFAQGMKLAQGRQELAHIRDLAYDTATVIVRYASGDTGTFVVSWGLPPGVVSFDSSDQILGSKGIAQVEYRITHQEVRTMREGGNWESVAVSDQDMYQNEIASFARCILEDQPPLATGEDGRAALRVALAALESVQTGQSVFLH